MLPEGSRVYECPYNSTSDLPLSDATRALFKSKKPALLRHHDAKVQKSTNHKPLEWMTNAAQIMGKSEEPAESNNGKGSQIESPSTQASDVPTLSYVSKDSLTEQTAHTESPETKPNLQHENVGAGSSSPIGSTALDKTKSFNQHHGTVRWVAGHDQSRGTPQATPPSRRKRRRLQTEGEGYTPPSGRVTGSKTLSAVDSHSAMSSTTVEESCSTKPSPAKKRRRADAEGARRRMARCGRQRNRWLSNDETE